MPVHSVVSDLHPKLPFPMPEVPRRTFHFHLQDGGILVASLGREFFAESLYGQGKVVGLYRARTQPRYSFSSLDDRFRRLLSVANQAAAFNGIFSFLLRL